MNYLDETWRARLQPADRREIWEWVTEEGELPQGIYAMPGRFDIETCPWLKEVFRALRNPVVRNVVVMACVQGLKTLAGELWLLWLVANDPGPTQWLMEDDEVAKDQARGRYMPLMEKFPAVARYFTENRFDKTQAFIRFAHMTMYLEGAHVRANLQRRSIKNQMRSEIWQADKWKAGRLAEASARLTQFRHNSKTYTESQPGWDHEYLLDDMHGAFLRGDRSELRFNCLGCGKSQVWQWDFRRLDGTRAGMRWDITERTRRENREWRWGELVQTVRYECIYCGHRHHDDPLTRRRLTTTLHYEPQAPDADVETRSFTWNQLAIPNLSWFEVGQFGGVKNFLLAHQAGNLGNDKPMMDFWMKAMSVPWDPARFAAIGDMETVELQPSATEGEALVMGGVTFEHRFMGIDVQWDHFWYVIEAWSKAGDELVLAAGRVEDWGAIEELQRHWHVPFQNVAVDISHRPQEVREQCALHGTVAMVRIGDQVGRRWLCWTGCRGSDQAHYIYVPKHGANKGKRIQLPYKWPPDKGDPCIGLKKSDPRRMQLRGKVCEVITWSNKAIKDIAIARHKGEVKGVQCFVGRGDWNGEFNRHMHSQRREPSSRGGFKWVKFRADHMLDCVCMIKVLAMARNGLLGVKA